MVNTSRSDCVSVTMYEFLAPWGVFAPAFCAALAYFAVVDYRKKRHMRMFEADPSPTRFAPLSVMHG